MASAVKSRESGFLEAAVGHLLLFGEELLLGLLRLQTGDGIAHHVHEGLGLGRPTASSLMMEAERALHHGGEIASLGQRERGFSRRQDPSPLSNQSSSPALLSRREGIGGKSALASAAKMSPALALPARPGFLLSAAFSSLPKQDQGMRHLTALGTLEQILMLVVVILGILLGDLDVLPRFCGIESR